MSCEDVSGDLEYVSIRVAFLYISGDESNRLTRPIYS